MVIPIGPLPALPQRPASAHKGTFGTSLIVGGSRGMSGAAILAGLAALRGGSGLVFVAIPESVYPIVAAAEPSYLTIPLNEDSDGQLTMTSLPVIQKQLDRCTAAGIGPGLGESHSLDQLVASLYSETPQPLVVDADALNSLARQPEVIGQHNGPRILTPHPGEMSRLVQTTTRDVQENRESLAKVFAREHNCIVVLKGQGTVVSDGEQLFINTTGNSGMATGGAGDVLTGLITSLLAQGMRPFEAAQLAVYIHGKAGDLAAEHYGKHGLIASDLPMYVAMAQKDLET